MSGRSNVAKYGVLGALVLYISSYVALSSRGCYVPGGWGLGFVRWYDWAPQGFASGPAGTKDNRQLLLFYFPLWIIDVRFVHTAEKARGGRYPINTLLDTQLQKSTEEWNRKKAAEWAAQNQQGGANGGQPVGSDTNPAPAAAASRESPRR